MNTESLKDLLHAKMTELDYQYLLIFLAKQKMKRGHLTQVLNTHLIRIYWLRQ